MSVKEKILALFKAYTDLSIKEITDTLLVSKQAVHYAMNQLLEEDTVEKFGKAPKTIYRIKKESLIPDTSDLDIDTEAADFLDKNFFLITETGKILTGIEAFSYWCLQRRLPIEKTVSEFISTKKKYDKYYQNSFIDDTDKLLHTKGFEKISIDKLFYKDFYTIERFGKTPLGVMMHFAKQGQNKMLMKMIVDKISDSVKDFIKKYNFDAIGFIPPTIRREVQIMNFFEKHLNINLPTIDIQKISGMIPVPQKSLQKIDERIRNAENTFAVRETISYKRVLLFDDAVGSGATINQVAEKVKNKKIAKEVYGLAVVGSFKGFDVITDV